MPASLPRRPPWHLLASTLGWDVRRLTAAELPMAQALLYAVYFEEGGWDPNPDNPSNLRAEHAQRRFMDDFDQTAVWVGIFDRSDRLAGVTRVLDPRRCGGLEVSRYAEPPPVPHARIGEANRVALQREFRGTLALTLLSAGGAWMARAMGLSYVIGTSTERIFERAARRQGWRPLGPVFRYHPSDPEPVLMMGFDLRAHAVLRLSLKRLARGLRRNHRLAPLPMTLRPAPHTPTNQAQRAHRDRPARPPLPREARWSILF